MKTTFFIAMSVFIIFLSGCVSKDWPDTGSDAAWYERTDPHAFLLHEERRRGPAAFIGLYNPDLRDPIVIPGVSRRDPLVSDYQTCTVGGYSKTDSAEKRRFLRAVTDFARRYNPEMLALLRQHPEYRIDDHSTETTARYSRFQNHGATSSVAER